MKRKLIALLLSTAMCFSIVSCSSDSSSSRRDRDDDEDEVEVEETEEEEEEEATPTTTPTPEPTATPTPTPVPTWLEEHDITITPQGDFTFDSTLMSWDGREYYNIETGTNDIVEISANVSIYETTEGMEEGYKKVVAVFVCDSSAAGDDLAYAWTSAFDRYTGLSLEVDPDTTYRQASAPGIVPIEIDGETYEVRYEFEAENNYPVIPSTVSVICPVDYDGTVFYCGCASQSRSSRMDNLDLTSHLYTVDELPYNSSNDYTYYYFTYTND